MIEPKTLLADLQRLLKRLEDDLRLRCKQHADVNDRVRAEYERARQAERTAAAYEIWRDEFITQAAVAWTLGSVFVRFIEDNGLVKTPHLAGAGDRLKLARDQHTLYFRQHPTHSDREYLEHVFHETARLPGVGALFDPGHNPLWLLGVSGDGATMLLDFWQQIDPVSGALVRDFTDADWNTRFLGDLYQDLSEAARKKYALLQTPIFVEEFILDRTLTPAIDEFGLHTVRLIDPTCGSGHFLLGAFARLFRLWQRQEPGTNPRRLAQNALDSVCGVDLNPFAVAIARFRLLMAALRVCEEKSLHDAPAFDIHVTTGDSLLHGPRAGMMRGQQRGLIADEFEHYYVTEDAATLQRILGRQYHTVVGNPPYITVKDAKLNALYRGRFDSCHMKYSLAVPFMERFFDLAITAEEDHSAGYVGMITANSFMKREFGKKLIERFIPRWDLTHVIDTSGAYIPGHGTPTVILFGRNRKPVASTIRTAMGIKGEPATPDDPALGLVWTAIVSQLDLPGSQSEFISVGDTARESFHRHPWSIGGGGAAELKELLDEVEGETLGSLSDSIGITSFTLEDDIFLLPRQAALRHKLPDEQLREMLIGDAIRDWQVSECDVAVFPYDEDYRPIANDANNLCLRYLWLARTSLANNKMFAGKTKVESGLQWYEFGRLTSDKLRTPLSITFAEVATHNHFVLDRGGKVFNRTAPVIKLPAEATEEEHLALLGLLNSSTACFWLRQVSFPKGGDYVGSEGARVRKTLWDERFAFDGSKVSQFPVSKEKPLSFAHTLDQLARQLQSTLPATLAAHAVPNAEVWRQAEAEAARLREQMIAWQEELDWQCYRLYEMTEESLFVVPPSGGGLEDPGQPPEGGTTNVDVPPLRLGERAFEIVMARKIAAGEVQTTWFERHGSTPVTELPAHWPDAYRRLVERRIALIETDHNIALIERPEYKRRWNSEPWAEQAERALRQWLLDRLEDARCWPQVELTSTAKLADRVRRDAEFLQVAEMFRGRADFDLTRLVTELVEAESVPFLPVLRYKAAGLEKRALWERTWGLQRREDEVRVRIEEELRQQIEEQTGKEAALELVEADIRRRVAEEVGEIPVPPKYVAKDFQSTTYWRLRGKLDVPKERFIRYPKCERDTDASPVIAWAGWDHLQQAQAIAAYYEQMRTEEGWPAERLLPLLAGLAELLPWLKQWHNAVDSAHGIRMGDFFESFLEGEARGMGKTIEAIKTLR